MSISQLHAYRYDFDKYDRAYVQELLGKGFVSGTTPCGSCNSDEECAVENMPARTPQSTSPDSILRGMGYDVRSCRRNTGKAISRYSSTAVQDKMRRSGISDISENDILNKVIAVDDYCNLAKTNATEVPMLEIVNGNLTLDADSKLESLPKLRRAGKITVVAKNKDEMYAYLRKLGILKDGLLAVTVMKSDKNNKGIDFVMKSYI